MADVQGLLSDPQFQALSPQDQQATATAIDPEFGTLSPADFKATAAAIAPPISKLESGIRGAAQGASFGFADELTGAGRAAMEAFQKGDVDNFLTNYKKYTELSRKNYKASEEANPLTYKAAEVAGAVAPMLVAPELSVGKLALAGGAMAAGKTEANPIEKPVEFAKDVAIGAGTGAAVGAAGKAIAAPLSKAATNISERIATVPTQGEFSVIPKIAESVGKTVGKTVSNTVGGPGAGTALGGAVGGPTGAMIGATVGKMALPVSAKIEKAVTEKTIGLITPPLEKLAPILQTRAPQLINILKNASAKGPQELAALSYSLQQTHPEYRAALDEAQGVR
jgi:hypothetical protein